MNKLYSLLVLAAIGGTMAEAKPRTQAEIYGAAKSALVKEVSAARYATNSSLKELLHSDAVTVVGLADNGKGFAIIANDDRLPAVLAIGDSEFIGNENENFKWWMDAIEMVSEAVVEHNQVVRTAVPAPDPSLYPTRVDPIVTSRWDQDEPYWNMCPTKSGRRCLTGCVATAIAQVFYSNKYPTTGFGTRTNNSASSVTANYGETTYRYDLMLDRYTAGSYTDEQADAVATLMLHCGIAVNMDYGPSASGAYSDQAADGIRQYFGVETAHLVERDYFSDAEWMDMLYNELSGGHAMYYSAVDRYGNGGHAFVCDGYDEQGRVHINWGWSGSNDGFFNIDLLNPSSYQFSLYQDMILGMFDPNDVRDNSVYIDTISVAAPGTLAGLVNDTMYIHLSGLKLEGNIDASDIAFIRELASCDTLKFSKLDLADATLVANALPDSAFTDCGLRNVVLPRNLQSIGVRAFSGCKNLSRITSFSYDVPKTGKNCFAGITAGNMTVSIIAGSRDYYLRNAQWKTICNEGNTFEFGTCVKANTINRKYGAANPVLGYVVEGVRILGSPELSCVATKDSPVGKYEITIEPGTLELNPDVVLVSGYMQVQKVALNISVKDAVRGFCEANPEFTFVYDGFVNDETEEVLTELPVAVCEADADSPLGEYEIVVSGASSPNYNIKYTNGKLTVVESSSISDVAAEESAAVFNLMGVRVDESNLNSGFFIKNNKIKVIK